MNDVSCYRGNRESPRPPQPISPHGRFASVRMVRGTVGPALTLVHFVLSLIHWKTQSVFQAVTRYTRDDLARLRTAGHRWFAAPCGHRSHYRGLHFVQASQFTAAQRAPPHSGRSVRNEKRTCSDLSDPRPDPAPRSRGRPRGRWPLEGRTRGSTRRTSGGVRGRSRASRGVPGCWCRTRRGPA